MRPPADPPNPFERLRLERSEPPPPAPVEVIEEPAGSVVSTNDSPDVSFRYSLNPYRGCQHACAYCYARRTHEYLGFGAGTDFERRIVVKTNAPAVLERELRQPRLRGELLAFSGVTDCYQPLEQRYELTRRCLEVCARRGNPVVVITKSPLVTRDLDVLERLHEGAGLRVLFSIPFLDGRVGRRIEPGVPPAAERFAAMRRLADAGLDTGLMVAPLIPGLNDAEIPALLEEAREHGARHARCILLRLPGSVRTVFLERLRAVLPERAAKVEARLRDARGGRLQDSRFGCRMGGEGPYWETLERLFDVQAGRLGLRRPPSFPPPRPARGFLPFGG